MAGLIQGLLSGNGRHTLSLEKPGDNDVVLCNETIRKGSKFLSEVTHTFSYSCKKGERITAVTAYDKWSDDTGGHPKLVRGGVGKKEVVIEVTSERNRGFHFQFIVYGTKGHSNHEKSHSDHDHTTTSNTSGLFSAITQVFCFCVRCLFPNAIYQVN